MATTTQEPKAAPQHKEVEHFSDEERTAWLKTGAMPALEEIPPKEDASAASIPAKEAGSGPAKKDKPDQDKNWRTLETERDALKAKAEAAEKELEEYRSGKRKPEEKKVDAAAPKLRELPKRPKMMDFRNADGALDSDKYEAALDKYEEDKTAYTNEQVQIRTASAQREEFAKTWQAEIKTIYGKEISVEDIHKVVGKLAETQQSSPAVFVQLNSSKFFPQLVQVFQGDPALLENFIKQANDPKTFPDAVRALFGMERDIEAELSKRDKEPPKDKPLTKAGKPPAEAAGGSSSPEDDGSSEAAWKRKDLSAAERGELYRERKNKEDREKKRKKVN